MGVGVVVRVVVLLEVVLLVLVSALGRRRRSTDGHEHEHEQDYEHAYAYVHAYVYAPKRFSRGPAKIPYPGGVWNFGRVGKCRSPIHASPPMCLATSSTAGLRSSVHHLPTKVTMPTSACA